MARNLAEAVIEIRTSGVGRVSTDTERLRRGLEGLDRTSRRAGAGLAGMGGTLSGIAGHLKSIAGLSAMAIPAVAAKQLTSNYAEIELALAKVRKTTDTSGESFIELKEALMQLGTEETIPFMDLLSIAEQAGQAGIRGTKDIVDFTRSVSRLADTSTLSADEAGRAINQIINTSNIRESSGEMRKAMVSDVEAIASVMTKLAGTTNATEQDIAQVANRIAGSSKLFGLSVDQTLAIASLGQDIGANPEAYGSAISRLMAEMTSAVGKGGAKLVEFAKLSGMSSEEFSKTIQENPIKALQRLAEGISKLDKISAQQSLDKLGLDGVITAGVLLKVAGASDILNKSLATASNEIKTITALLAEYKTQNDTILKQWQQLKNIISVESGKRFEPAGNMIKGGLTYLNDNPKVVSGMIDSGLSAAQPSLISLLMQAVGKPPEIDRVEELKVNTISKFEPDMPQEMDPRDFRDRAEMNKITQSLSPDVKLRGQLKQGAFEFVDKFGPRFRSLVSAAGDDFSQIFANIWEDGRKAFEERRAAENAALAGDILGQYNSQQEARKRGIQFTNPLDFARDIQSMGTSRKSIEQLTKDGIKEAKEQKEILRRIEQEIAAQGGII